MATIDDVAKKAGVSKSSVSRVLNNNYNHMSEEMKIKIQQAIQELNYKPNSVAQSLKKKETMVIGLVLADLAPFWAEVIKGIQDEAMKNGYSLMVSDSSMNPSSEENNIDLLVSRQVDGLIINTINPNSMIFNQLKSEKIPFVFVNSRSEQIDEDLVVVDNTHGTIEALEYLIELGHKRIAIMLYPIENIMVRQERLDAYRKGLRQNNLPIDESLIKICKPEKDNGVETTLELLKMENRPTAFLSTNANLTLEVLKGVRMAGLHVPNDISVIGYDDFDWTPLLDPPLTTVAINGFDMGSKATNILIKKIKRKTKKKPETLKIIPELIIRNSSGMLKANAFEEINSSI
ncbi:LacI family DNA-binding transcriptional regulator [Bacillus sp. MRMR6]|uniref:LacI family DNA-binding transcriptional regulator n=1 Tax=Bacillus sp. MRMR6 TaxID=1928617 RepID=UPI0009529010|nr:LacI family DNA-binding transcriptional regulator [Bacillus sp. MRMR6]OLS40781.1 transcriptional regulator [Bacillus sp. MRMR6]